MKKRNQTPSRRRFLRTGAVAACATPLVLAEKKSGTQPVLVGSGTHRYEVMPDWGKLPATYQYGFTHGIGIDSHNRFFIFNTGKTQLIIFDDKGKFVKSWGSEYPGAHGLHLNKEGKQEFLYLTDYIRHIFLKTTLDGEVVWTRSYPKESGFYTGEEQFKPTNIAVAPSGDFYVADGYGNDWIHQYNAKAEYIRSWGGTGTEPGKLRQPHGIWLDTRGAQPTLLIADRVNVRLQSFTLDGNYLSMATDELRFPCHFYQYKDEMYIPDLHGRVTVFDKNNKLIVHLGDDPGVEKRAGFPNFPHDQRIAGKFISPHSACVDRSGNVYVVEFVNDGRVTKLKKVSS